MLTTLETAAVRIAEANGGTRIEGMAEGPERAGAVTLWVDVGTVYLSAECAVGRCPASRREILTLVLGDEAGAERHLVFAFGTPVVDADGRAAGRLGGARSARRELLALMQAAKAAPERLAAETFDLLAAA